MKTGRILTVAGVAIIGLSVAAFAEDRQESDFVIRMSALLPENSEDWESAGGAEAQLRFWNGPHFATALSIGVESWRATSEYTEDYDGSSLVSTTVDGDMSLLPVGASLILKNDISRNVSVTLEAGLRYVFVSSDLSAEVAYTDAGGTSYINEKIKPENFIAGLVGLNVEARLLEDVRLQVGVGYQFDLTKPHEKFMGEDIGSTDFSAVVVSVGLQWRL